MLVLLTVTGIHVPAIPLVETAGNMGACAPAQIGAMAANVAVVVGVTVTILLAEVARQAAPPVVTL